MVLQMMIENKTTEFKREYIDDIKNTVIAFANCDGGTIYIGIHDDGSICGVADVDGTMLRVANAIRDAIRPDITMFVEYTSEIMENKNIICVRVQRGTARPYYLHGKGIRPEGVYVRQGASSVPASSAAILSMIKETSGDSYEEARSLNQQLTFEATQEFFSKRKVDLGPTQMRTLSMIGNDGTYTNLAYLLSDQSAHSIKLAVFEGDKKSVFKDRSECSGSLFSQLDEAYRFIDRHNRTRAEFIGLDRVDIRDYPTAAIREALLNAIVHRDYSFSGSILISIFDDRMEFVTIGGLVKGITLEDINLGISVLRNERLANIFYRLNLIEAYGTGILKINECYTDYTKKPRIEATDNAFKIILPNINYYTEKKTSEEVPPTAKTKKDDRKNAVIALCRKNEAVTRKDIETTLGLSQASAISLLREMSESGTLIKTGKGKNLKYRLN